MKWRNQRESVNIRDMRNISQNDLRAQPRIEQAFQDVKADKTTDEIKLRVNKIFSKRDRKYFPRNPG